MPSESRPGRTPFAYYGRLSERGRRLYDRSDALAEVHLEEPCRHEGMVGAVRDALLRADRSAVERASAALLLGLTDSLGVPPVTIEVLATRPSSRSGELHGLYTRDDGREPRIRLWMRTAKHGRVVAFRTFLRTLLHEVCHHLDYTLFSLPDSLHTEGFFRRESSLFRQLVPAGEPPAREEP